MAVLWRMVLESRVCQGGRTQLLGLGGSLNWVVVNYCSYSVRDPFTRAPCLRRRGKDAAFNVR